jgi:23S rRNA (cytosine1962-C5)-methyltransferase
MSSIILKPGKERRLLFGHPWIYAGDIAKITGEAADGDAVDIRDHKNRHHGRGLLNRNSQITVRRYTTGKEELDAAFLRQRIQAAWQARAPAAAFRVVFAEADQLPGLIVDKFGEHLVVQFLTLGMDRRKPVIVEILRDLLKPAAIIERSDVHTRKLEGLPEFKGVLTGHTDGTTVIAPGGVQFEVQLLDDQKTGFFLDQAENYPLVAAHCAGKRVLDCFSYHGGFALYAAQAGAKQIEAVEISEPAVGRAKRNAELNGLTGAIEFRCANAFDVLKKSDADHRQFDVVILDPPTFTRTKDKVDDALRGYKEINLRALKMLPAGGWLATFSCSHHITSELLRDVVVAAAADARKTVRLVKTLTQSADHPILLAVPETEYLKGLLVQVI